MKISSSLGLGATTLSPMANAKILKSVGFDGIDFQFCGQYSTTNIFREGVTEGIIAKCEEIKKIGLEISQTHLHYLSSEHYGPGRYPEFGMRKKRTGSPGKGIHCQCLRGIHGGIL